MSDRRKEIVAAAYDSLGEHYLEWSAQIADEPRARLLGEIVRRLPAGSRVLDLGCGAGVPSTRQLASAFDVLGVDISQRQITAARRNVPKATFLVADFAELHFPTGSFDGVTALYTISHVPREQHEELFVQIGDWLTPGGLFLATLGAADSPDWIGQWLEVPMFFSSYGPPKNRQMLLAAGFELVVDEILETNEPEGPVAFQWVLARKRIQPVSPTVTPSSQPDNAAPAQDPRENGPPAHARP